MGLQPWHILLGLSLALLVIWIPVLREQRRTKNNPNNQSNQKKP